MVRVYLIVVSNVNKLRTPEDDHLAENHTRPSPLVLREKLARVAKSRTSSIQKRSSKMPNMSKKSPRTTYTFRTSEPSVSSRSGPIDFNLEASQALSTLTQSSTPQPADASEDGSVVTRGKSPTKLGARNTLGNAIKSEAIDLANEFTESSSLPRSTLLESLTQQKTSLLATEAVTTRSKSIASTKSILNTWGNSELLL